MYRILSGAARRQRIGSDLLHRQKAASCRKPAGYFCPHRHFLGVLQAHFELHRAFRGEQALLARDLPRATRFLYTPAGGKRFGFKIRVAFH